MVSTGVPRARRNPNQRFARTKEKAMPRGDKSSYSKKQQRQAQHLEESYEERGWGRHEQGRRGWSNVNREPGGGRKSSSGRRRQTAYE